MIANSFTSKKSVVIIIATFIEHEMQKGFIIKLSGTLEHTSLMAIL